MPVQTVVCMLINSHDLFNEVAVRKGCEVERLMRGKHWLVLVSTEMGRFCFNQSQE